MGSDVYGTVFYGMVITNQDNINTIGGWDDWIDGWEETYLEKSGMDNQGPDDKKEFEEYWAKRRAVLDGAMCELGHSGYDGGGHLYIYITESRETSEWGSMVKFNPEIKPIWEYKIKKFCEALGFEYVAPAWYVTSKYW